MKYTRVLSSSLAIFAALSLTACGHIQKEISSEETMLEKAEFATGIDSNNLKIVEGSVSGSLDAVNYKVKSRKGQVFRCYFTSAIAITSDAICTPIDSTGKAFQEQKKKYAKDGRCIPNSRRHLCTTVLR